MAQGTRGRLALLGTGLLACLGCMEPDNKLGSRPPAAKSQMGSTVKPNQPGGPSTTYGAGVQQAGFNTNGRPNPSPDYFKTTGSMTPTVPGAIGTGNSMAPPTGVIPPATPGGYTGSAVPGGRAATPTQPPYGYESLPPAAPGAAGSAFPVPPTAPPGAGTPLFGGN